MQLYAQLSVIFTSFIFWFYIDSVSIFNNKRIINSALIHSILLSISINLGYLFNPSIIYTFTFDEDVKQIYNFLGYISIGYSYYDLYIGIKSKQIDNIMHGGIFAISSSYLYINDNLFLTVILLVTETSSIFLNLRPLQIKIIDILFVFSFFLYRLVFIPFVFVIYLTEPNNKDMLFAYTCSFTLTLLNMYWFYFIMKKAIRQIQSHPHSS